jgi:hypothetical protein
MLISDVKWLMSKVEEEGYRGTPYLGYDTVENFIDAVSYGISVFLGARSMVTGTLKEQVVWLELDGIRGDEKKGRCVSATDIFYL